MQRRAKNRAHYQAGQVPITFKFLEFLKPGGLKVGSFKNRQAQLWDSPEGFRKHSLVLKENV